MRRAHGHDFAYGDREHAAGLGRRGMLKGASLAAIGAAIGAAIPFGRFMPQGYVPVALAQDAKLDVIALHVHDENAIPAFTDQPQHEHDAWAREFLARYCPWGIGTVRLERRVGRSDELLPEVAEQVGCDLIALGWTQQLEAGRAPVVRAALERAPVPVLLVPVYVRSEPREGVTT